MVYILREVFSGTHKKTLSLVLSIYYKYAHGFFGTGTPAPTRFPMNTLGISTKPGSKPEQNPPTPSENLPTLNSKPETLNPEAETLISKP